MSVWSIKRDHMQLSHCRASPSCLEPCPPAPLPGTLSFPPRQQGIAVRSGTPSTGRAPQLPEPFLPPTCPHHCPWSPLLVKASGLALSWLLAPSGPAFCTACVGAVCCVSEGECGRGVEGPAELTQGKPCVRALRLSGRKGER